MHKTTVEIKSSLGYHQVVLNGKTKHNCQYPLLPTILIRIDRCGPQSCWSIMPLSIIVRNTSSPWWPSVSPRTNQVFPRSCKKRHVLISCVTLYTFIPRIMWPVIAKSSSTKYWLGVQDKTIAETNHGFISIHDFMIALLKHEYLMQQSCTFVFNFNFWQN